MKNYKWNSHPAYLKVKSDSEWLDINNLLACLSSRKKKAVIVYKEFMDIGLDDEVVKFFSKKSQSSIFSYNSLVEMIKEKKFQRDYYRNKGICNKFNIEEGVLLQTSRGAKNTPRLFAISLLRELSGFIFPAIAKRYSVKSYKTIASSNFRLKERMKKSTKIKSEYTKLKKL